MWELGEEVGQNSSAIVRAQAPIQVGKTVPVGSEGDSAVGHRPEQNRRLGHGAKEATRETSCLSAASLKFPHLRSAGSADFGRALIFWFFWIKPKEQQRESGRTGLVRVKVQSTSCVTSVNDADAVRK